MGQRGSLCNMETKITWETQSQTSDYCGFVRKLLLLSCTYMIVTVGTLHQGWQEHIKQSLLPLW